MKETSKRPDLGVLGVETAERGSSGGEKVSSSGGAGVQKAVHTVNPFEPLCEAPGPFVSESQGQGILPGPRHRIKDVSKHALWVWNSLGASSRGCLSPCHLPPEERSLDQRVRCELWSLFIGYATSGRG